MVLAPETVTVSVLPLPSTLYWTEYPVMAPFWWIHGTSPHWTVMTEEFTSVTVTPGGGTDGTGGTELSEYGNTQRETLGY